MKKILHLLASNKFSGAENVVCTIIDKFKGQYDMCYCSLNGPIKDVLDERSINFYGLNKLTVSNLKKVIKVYNPDIIHAHDYTASVVASLCGFKGKIISHIHINASFARKWNLKSILYSVTIPKYFTIIGVSNAVYEEAIFKNKMKGKFKTLYNFVDKEDIISKSNMYEFDGDYDLYFLGRLNDLKNPLEFIEIVNIIKGSFSQVKALIIGDGELKNKCIDKINFYNLQDNIDILGFVSNPFPIIKKCKVGIMPSKVEGFGLTAIESMILNKPVLNSGVGGLGEIFNNNQFFICDRNDYAIKFYDIIDGKYDFSNLVDKFTDLDKWKTELEKIYR